MFVPKKESKSRQMMMLVGGDTDINFVTLVNHMIYPFLSAVNTEPSNVREVSEGTEEGRTVKPVGAQR